jgi:hypothetical protein
MVSESPSFGASLRNLCIGSALVGEAEHSKGIRSGAIIIIIIMMMAEHHGRTREGMASNTAAAR